MAGFRRRVRWRLEAGVVRALFALFGVLPVDWASALGGSLTRLIGPHLKASTVARRNLARAFPEMAPEHIEELVGEVWENLGRVVGEFRHAHWLIRHRVEVVDLHHVHAMRDDGQPGIFVSAHFGNWELAGALADREGMPLTVLYRAANNPWVERIYRQGRAASAGGGQIAKGAQGAKLALGVLRQGGHLGILIDQKMNDGIAVPFFGRPAMTAPAVSRFAVRFRCPVVPVKIERLKGAHFRMTFYPPQPLPASGDSHQDTLELMTALNALVEEWIRAKPGQWLWLHKRWPE